jgi:hypothetical protein
MILPPFETLRRHYPTDSDPDAVRLRIGGQIGAMPSRTNTCVMRMSQAFNYAGPNYAIPDNPKAPVKLYTLKGKDGKNYAVRVAEFVRYLHVRYGRPSISTHYSDVSKASGYKQAVSESITPFTGKTGIIAWHVQGWGDATGHFTLWDGNTGLYEGGEDYFKDFPRQATDPSTGKPIFRPDGSPYMLWESGIDFWPC